jgi:hypothetical protein
LSRWVKNRPVNCHNRLTSAEDHEEASLLGCPPIGLLDDGSLNDEFWKAKWPYIPVYPWPTTPRLYGPFGNVGEDFADRANDRGLMVGAILGPTRRYEAYGKYCKSNKINILTTHWFHLLMLGLAGLTRHLLPRRAAQDGTMDRAITEPLRLA